MRIKITEIHDEGLNLDYGESPQELDLLFPDTSFEGSIRVKAQLNRVDQLVIGSGVVSATLVMGCGRCGRSFSLPLQLDFRAAFSRKQTSEGKKGQEHEISWEEAGSYWIENESIDLSEFIREHILLSIPMVPLCRAECKGICPRCGQNRNEVICRCELEEQYGPPKT